MVEPYDCQAAGENILGIWDAQPGDYALPMSQYTIRLAERADNIARCFPVMAQLRPHLEKRDFVDRVRRQKAEGFKLAFLEEEGVVRAVAGFRIFEKLTVGRQMYVDDLVTDEQHRSRGCGRALLDWLKQHARSAGCTELQLDSGVNRYHAHAFYFREGMHISSYHFMVKLT